MPVEQFSSQSALFNSFEYLSNSYCSSNYWGESSSAPQATTTNVVTVTVPFSNMFSFSVNVQGGMANIVINY